MLSGAVRGFSGFGSALIYVPLMSALYGPQIGAASFLLIDFVTGIVFSIGVWRQAAWREIVPLAVAAVVRGAIRHADPAIRRPRAPALGDGRAGAGDRRRALDSGWRYHGKPMLIVTILVGLAAGVLGGAVQIFGPPVVLFWLSSMATAAMVRANFVVFFAIMAAALIVTYLWSGLLTADVIALAAFCRRRCISCAMFGGREAVPLAPRRQTYRRVAYAIITLAALVSMPLWDGWLR